MNDFSVCLREYIPVLFQDSPNLQLPNNCSNKVSQEVVSIYRVLRLPARIINFNRFLYCKPGILRNRTIDDKIMYDPNDVRLNYPFYRLQLYVERLETHLNEPTNQNLIKAYQVFKILKTVFIYNAWGTSVIYRPIFPSSLTIAHLFYLLDFLLLILSLTFT